MSDQCEHGQLGRTCLLCEMRDENLALRAQVVEKDARNLRLEREKTLYGHALNKASIAFAKDDTESVRRLLCGYDALSFLAQLRDDELTALRAKLADCQAVIRGRGHDADCPAVECRQCSHRGEHHSYYEDAGIISHQFQPGPCSDACGHDRTTGEKV